MTATLLQRASKASRQLEVAHQIVCVGKGGTEQLDRVTISKPQPGPGEVCVRVEFAGVCFADTLVRKGMYPKIPPYPFVPGYECAGIVDCIGSAVTSFAPGDRVGAYLPRFGAYREYIVARPQDLVHIPSQVSTAQAASMVVNYLSAFVLLHQLGKVKAGERLLVTSAAGGVGTAVLDLGRLAGLEMFGTASSHKHRTLISRGAKAIDYQTQDIEAEVRKYAPGGIDVVIDNVGGETLTKGYRLLRKGGRLLSNGILSVQGTSSMAYLPVFFSIYARRLIPDGKTSIFNTGLPPLVAKDPNWYRTTMRELLSLVASNAITPLISKTFPLSHVAEAHRLLESGQAQGKILLDCRG